MNVVLNIVALDCQSEETAVEMLDRSEKDFAGIRKNSNPPAS